MDHHCVGRGLYGAPRADIHDRGCVFTRGARASNHIDLDDIARPDVGRGLEPAGTAWVVYLDDSRERSACEGARVFLSRPGTIRVGAHSNATWMDNLDDHLVALGIAARGDEVALWKR